MSEQVGQIPTKTRCRDMRRRYGITKKDRDRMLHEQEGCCAVCGAHYSCDIRHRGSSVLHVDHCHDTGKVRALLCSHCNRGLGHFMDDPQLLAAAAEYLTYWRLTHAVQ
jgi:hypothetical protein